MSTNQHDPAERDPDDTRADPSVTVVARRAAMALIAVANFMAANRDAIAPIGFARDAEDRECPPESPMAVRWSCLGAVHKCVAEEIEAHGLSMELRAAVDALVDQALGLTAKRRFGFDSPALGDAKPHCGFLWLTTRCGSVEQAIDAARSAAALLEAMSAPEVDALLRCEPFDAADLARLRVLGRT